MHHSLHPAEYVIEESLTLEVGGIPYEFAVKATVFGELLSIENLFTRLPEAAQKLTLGGSHNDIIWRLNHFERLFKYKLALLMVNSREPAGPLANLLQSIRRRREQLGLPPHPAEPDRVQDEWTRAFFRYCPEPRKENKGTREERETYIERQQKLRMFGGLFQTDNGKPAHTIQWLASRKMELAGPVIFDLISCLPEDENLSVAYECLRFFPNTRGKELLLSHALKESKRPHRAAILKGLSGFKDPEILKFYVDLYRNSYDTLNREEVTGLAMGLENYPVSEVKAIGWEILSTPAKSGKYQAFHLMKSLGVPVANIGRGLWPVFYQLEDPGLIRDYLEIFIELRNHELTPPTGYLTGLFEKHCINDEDHNRLAAPLSDLLSYKPDFQVEKKMRQWLSDESECLQLAAVAGMKNFVIQGGYRPSDDVLSMIAGFLKDESQEIRTAAMDLVRQIPQIIRKPEFVSLLLDVSKGENGRPNRAVLMAINNLLEYVPFPSEIVPFYLELLEDDYEQIRQDALRGLKYSFDEDIRRRFKKMEADDPAESVRMEAFRAWRFSKKREYQLHGDLPEQTHQPPKQQKVEHLPKELKPDSRQSNGHDTFVSKMISRIQSFFKKP